LLQGVGFCEGVFLVAGDFRVEAEPPD